MFQKPAFGANTSGFGMQSTFGASPSTSASPFGGFKTTGATSAFGAPPAFGASTPAQPTATGGLFGASATTGGLFGGGAAAGAAPAFGAPSTGFSFGASTSTGGGGLFSNNTSTGGLFANTQQNNAFGAKPAGFGFGGTPTNPAQSTALFGNTSAGSGLFGQQNTSLGGGGLFSNNTGGFGQQTATGTGHVKYNPVVGSDVVVKGGASQNVSVKHHCITCMKEYEGKSLEELRLEDYTAGRKGNAGGGMFPFQQQQQQAAKPLFGASTSFGGAATTSAPSVFGGGLGTGGAFGQTNSFAFGGNTQPSTNSTGLFGANKPAFGATPSTGTGLFGSTATTQAPAFGTSTAPSFGFGSNMQNQSTGGIFGAKPATSSVFGTPSTGLGAFGGGGMFAAKPTQTQAPTFGAPQPGLGTTALGFGATTSTSGSLFGGGAFNKPATSQPAFGFGTTQPTLGTGLGGSAFQSKPAAAPFGQLGTTSMFQNPNANTSLNLGGGLGGGSMFGNTSTLGNTSLQLGGNTNYSLANNLSGASAAGNVHEQILTLAARPYGDSPLFKDLLPDSSTTAEDALRPTNPAAMQAVLDKAASSYRVTSPNGTRLKLQPKTAQTQHKKSLFDGLEEYDASLEDKLSLKPSRKRLVLRGNQQNQSANDSADLSHAAASYRSQEEPPHPQHPECNGEAQRDGAIETAAGAPPRASETDAERAKRNISFENNTNLDVTSDRQGSWLSASKMPWGESKEKPIDNEPTPRLYPNLDKELPSDGTERRASWLTTKPLRKPLVSPPQSAEHSVRELNIRPPAQTSPDNKENMQSAADEIPPPREAPPHPAGIKLTRDGYYTIPSLEEMKEYTSPDGTCIVPELTIGRTHYGNVYYDSEVDVTGLDLDQLVHFFNKEVVIYPDDGVKPPVGEGLNKRAIVTLDRVWPRDKTQNRPITEPDRLWEFERKLRRVCEKHDTKFIEYRTETGSWVFRVEHFSKYGLTDSDEEDDVTPEVLRRQLANQALQNNAAPSMLPPLSAQSPGLGGLGLGAPKAGLGGLGLMSNGMGLTSKGMPVTSGLAATSGMDLTSSMSHGVGSDSIFCMQQASLNLLNGARGFEMDTTEDNAESQSLYQDNRAYGVKSPTTELARLEHTQSHHVQLMKASLYADTEMEDDISISTGDQLVPMCAALPPLTQAAPSLPAAAEGDTSERTLLPTSEEVEMPPLIVKPHTIILKYHRKVPPFKHTIAGRLGAEFMSDLSVARARHSRVGFGPRGDIVYATTYDALTDLDTTAELSELDKYTRGRDSHDWSEAVVARLALQHPDHHYNIQEVLGRQLETLFKYSEFVEAPSSEQCPQLKLVEEPAQRHAVLLGLLSDAERSKGANRKFGVSGAYCYEVWKLCDALWGADLLNGGVPGTDALATVSRHRSLLQWLTEAVATITEQELALPRKAEEEDECDSHSALVWTLLLGGRVAEACKLARDRGDLYLATLIAQAGGDPSFRSLISRQLSQWRECGAEGLVSSHRRAALHLLAGAAPRGHLARAHWLQALHATARFLCPHVPSLEQVLRKYESLFTHEEHHSSAEEEVDLTVVDADEMDMQLPVPPYADSYDVVLTRGSKQKRMLDLRYELIRARALNARPAPRPAQCTQDTLDHSLCFVLGVWFGNPNQFDVVGAADQLEAAGAWHLAVQALCYHPSATARNHLIRNVLSRHAPSKADTPELKTRIELIKKLRVPEKWLLIAQAHRAKYEHRPALEAEHLAAAEQWNAAHEVLMRDILAKAVLNDTLHQHANLLSSLHAAAQQYKISGWQHGGDAVYLYLTLCTEIRGLVSGGERAGSALRARLEALRPAVAAACNALPHHPARSPVQAAARAEMGARLVQVAGAAGEGAPRLAALLRLLALPPDCSAATQHKIAMDLAEQASELCIESASSSPISSHHRATAASS